MRLMRIFCLFLLGTSAVPALAGQFPQMQVLVNGTPLPEHYHKGTTYLEAIKGKEYAIRITNPIGARVAVALSVDGLNSIDARHTEACSGRKWVLGPYESIVISGWQMNSRQARRFFFTTEDQSYGARLGQMKNLGIISAAFFKEKARRPKKPIHIQPAVQTPVGSKSQEDLKEKAEGEQADMHRLQSEQNESHAKALNPAEEYAATGIGERMSHEVRWIQMNLEERPFAVVNLRYEFRPVLIKLGIVPPLVTHDSLTRREQAEGFRGVVYCPEP
jgi:hypothetical protein